MANENKTLEALTWKTLTLQNLAIQIKNIGDFILVVCLLLLAVSVVARIIRRRLNADGWLEFGFFLFALSFAFASILLKLGLLDADVFWSVFIASFLGFIASIIIGKWQEHKENLRARQQEALEKKRAILLLKSEIKTNLEIAKKIQDYCNSVPSFVGSAFTNRSEDCFSFRFQMIARNSFWKLLGKSDVETSSIDQIANFYISLEHCNNLLTVSFEYIRDRMSPGSIAENYRQAVITSPWGLQLTNLLSQIISDGQNIKL